MPDQLTDAPAADGTGPAASGDAGAPSSERSRGWPRWRRSVVQALVIVVVFVLAGLGGGWLWHHLYDAPRGIAYQGRWLGYDEGDYRDLFSGTAIYALIGAGAGLVLGLVCSFLLARDEVVTLLAVALGSALAALVMARLGMHLGNPDPDTVAKTAKDGTAIYGDLRLARWTVGLVWPATAVLGSALVFFLSGGRGRPRDSATGRGGA